MNNLVFILLLVSCTDDFNRCYTNKTMVETYKTAQDCEQAMIPSTKKFSSYGQQIFAQCTSIQANLQQQVKLNWFVTNRGNFLVKSQKRDDKASHEHETDLLSFSFPLNLSSTNLLHKTP